MNYKEASEQFERGNNEGHGYSCGSPQARCYSGCVCGGNDPACRPAEAAKFEGWEILEQGVDGNVLARKPSGSCVFVAYAHGPWAVDLTESPVFVEIAHSGPYTVGTVDGLACAWASEDGPGGFLLLEDATAWADCPELREELMALAKPQANQQSLPQIHVPKHWEFTPDDFRCQERSQGHEFTEFEPMGFTDETERFKTVSHPVFKMCCRWCGIFAVEIRRPNRKPEIIGALESTTESRLIAEANILKEMMQK